MEEKRKIFDEVSSFLRKRGYGIVVDQVNEELTSGRLFEKKIPTLAEPDPGSSGSFLSEVEFKKTAPAKFIERQEYSEAEALALLLQASKRAILDGIAMVSEVKKTMIEFGLDDFVFESEYDNNERFEVLINNLGSLNEQEERVSKFDEIIGRVRGA